MQKCIVGRKLGMTQLFDENGKFIPVTVVEAGPCVVVQKKTIENDGYEAVQIGFGEVTSKHVNKPLQGHFAKSDVAMKKVLREFRLDDCAALNVGDLIKADVFANGDKVDVCGTSKGKGYAGTIKRYGNHRLKETHGTGPVAQTRRLQWAPAPTRPAYSRANVCPATWALKESPVQNLEIVKVDVENNLIAIKGAIPGAKNGVVYITDSVKMA